ncbi:MAG TPA: glucose-1-phosphate thymidylyltransferase [Firmicutes bacterium]|nr:glucose-1-phosphate thymidylyltransferase [Bacillota bacterium]
MKGLILAGGKGTRLRPITHTSAKQLVPVANKPILFYAIETLKEAGIEDIGMIIGDTGPEVRAAVGDGSRWGVRITYLPQEAPLGLAHAVQTAKDFLYPDPFVMFLGDNLIKGGIVSFVERFRATQPNALILLTHVPNPREFGVAELADGRVVRLVEKPKEPKSDLALVGVYLFDQNIFEAISHIKPSWRGELEITDAIQWLVENGFAVEPHLVEGWWKDTGKLADLLEANRLILEDVDQDVRGTVTGDSQVEGRVVVEEGAEIVDSLVRGPAVIGAGARIVNSFIGPFTSVADGVTIENSEVEHSIILSGSTIRDLGGRLVDSLVGKNVEVRRIDTKPRAYRLMVGDNSQVGVV